MKAIKKYYIIAFIILSILPFVLLPVLSSNLDENRTLQSLPSFIAKEGGINLKWFGEIQDYVADHFAFREVLVEADSCVKQKVLNTPSDSQVIFGEGDWLFYSATLDDYAGCELTDEEFDTIAANLSGACARLTKAGKKPLVLIVPNKSRVYSEYMPKSYGEPREMCNLTRLQYLMKEQGIPYVDAAKILTEGKATDELYLHGDTHWNNTGARLVLNAVYEAWGIDARHELGGYSISNTHEGDLYDMIYPTSDYLEAQRDYSDVDENTFKYRKKPKSMDDMEINTSSEDAAATSVFVYRDSFGRAMIPYMSQIFGECTYVRSTPYDVNKALSSDAEYVLIEIVERNIRDLGNMEQ